MIQQLTIRLDNKPGTLQRCVGLLAQHGVDIKALEVTERGDGRYGEVHLIASNVDKAVQALEGASHDYSVDDVLAVEMDDRIGGLAAILNALGNREINIRSLYAFVSRMEGKSLAVIDVANPVGARKALEEAGAVLVTRKRIESADDDSAPGNPLPLASLEDHFGGDFIW